MSERAWFGAMFVLGLVAAISVGAARLGVDSFYARHEGVPVVTPKSTSERTRGTALATAPVATATEKSDAVETTSMDQSGRAEVDSTPRLDTSEPTGTIRLDTARSDASEPTTIVSEPTRTVRSDIVSSTIRSDATEAGSRAATGVPSIRTEPERNTGAAGSSKRSRHAAVTPSSKGSGPTVVVRSAPAIPHVARRVGRARILARRQTPPILVIRGPVSTDVPGRHGPRIIQIAPPPHRR